MAVIRLFLLLVVLGGLTLLLVQNFSPVIPLTFLGMKTQALPLAIWILFSTAAGAFTSLLITSLFKLSNYFVGKQLPRLESPASYTSEKSTRFEDNRSRPETPPSKSASKTVSRKADDDWDTDNSAEDDWEFTGQKGGEYRSTGSSTSSQNTKQTQPEPKNSSSSGSYSYSYNEPKNTGVGKTESIYDADYKVIIPPYRPSSTDKADDDDWGFLDDDDEDKDKRSSK